MIAYLDTSALLRIVLREAGALDDLRTYEGLVSSELIAVESTRTIDRLRAHGASALIWCDRLGPLPQLVTHDAALGAAARGFGFDVRGIRGKSARRSQTADDAVAEIVPCCPPAWVKSFRRRD